MFKSTKCNYVIDIWDLSEKLDYVGASYLHSILHSNLSLHYRRHHRRSRNPEAGWLVPRMFCF